MHRFLPSQLISLLIFLATPLLSLPALSQNSIPTPASTSTAVSPQTHSQPITLDYIHLKDDHGIPSPNASMPRSISWSPHQHWLAYTITDRSSNTTIHLLNADSPQTATSFSLTQFQNIASQQFGLTLPASPHSLTNPHPPRAGDPSPTPSPAPTISTNTPPTPPKPTVSWLTPNPANILRIQWNQVSLDFNPDQALWTLPNTNASAHPNPSTRSSAPHQRLPTGASESQVSPQNQWHAYVLSNDLYVVRITPNSRRSPRPIRITRDGSGTRLNGLHSWVYWEEIMNRSTWRAYQWSPQHERIALLQTDESAVGIQPILDFSKTQASTHFQRYPKAGTPNPSVRLGIWDSSRNTLRWVQWTNTSWEYLARFQWAPDGNTLLVQTLNRAQNHLILWAIDSQLLRQRPLLEERSTTWVDIFGDPLFLEGRDEFLWVSERTGYRHLYLYKKDGTLIRPLTSGSWDMGDPFSTSGIQYHPQRDTVTFPASRDSALERHFYSVAREGGPLTKLTSGAGHHGRLQFSKDGLFAVDEWGGATTLPSCNVIHHQGGQIAQLGRVTMADYAPYRLHQPELKTFQGSSGDTFHYRITLPQGFQPGKRYPLVAFVYGEPAGQVVRNAAPDPWESVLAEHGFIAAAFDARGTPGRGRAWLESIYKDQATRPLQDWTEWVQHLGTHSFVDTNRLGVWGWSGGGTMTCQLMLQRPGLFKAGAAVAAVTDKRLYDTIYTERYLGLPEENPEGYRKSSPLSFASRLQGHLLLAHGVSDDNVHVQNVYQLLTALTQAGKPYELYLYPEKDHGIGGKEHRHHLYQRLLEFFEKNLHPESQPGDPPSPQPQQ